MGVKIIRRSGLPIELDQLDSFKAEWKIKFDGLSKKHGNDMLSLQEDLAKLEKEMDVKYNTIGDVPLANSKKKLLSMLDMYGNILLTTHAQTGELIYLIEDQDSESVF